jgi:hypothetical protein
MAHPHSSLTMRDAAKLLVQQGNQLVEALNPVGTGAIGCDVVGIV